MYWLIFSFFLLNIVFLGFVHVTVLYTRFILFNISVVLHGREFQHHLFIHSHVGGIHLGYFLVLGWYKPFYPIERLVACLVHIRSRTSGHRLCSFSILLHINKLLSKLFPYFHFFTHLTICQTTGILPSGEFEIQSCFHLYFFWLLMNFCIISFVYAPPQFSLL